VLRQKHHAHGTGPEAVLDSVVAQDHAVRRTRQSTVQLVGRQQAGIDQSISQPLRLTVDGQGFAGLLEKLSDGADIDELLLEQSVEKLSGGYGQGAILRRTGRLLDRSSIVFVGLSLLPSF
jgi:hypothetical protein